MAASKILITIDDNLLKQLDLMVKSNVYPSRSEAIQEAVADKLERVKRTRLAQECAKA
jgi:metal-responsive CopG/Arc/MetJ family transcriptional regulator